MDKKREITELGNLIMKGMLLAHEKLVKEKIKNDEYIIFSENGKIFKIKAKEFAQAE